LTLPPPPPRSTLFPYTTLFRSACRLVRAEPRRLDRCHRGSCREAESLASETARRGARHRAFGADARRDADRHGRGGASTLHPVRSEEHTSELQSRENLVCRLLL